MQAKNEQKNGAKNKSKKAILNPSKTSGTEIPLSEYGDLLDTETTCQLLHISTNTLYKWVGRGIIPHYKLTGKKLLFNKRKIYQWLENNSVN